MRGTSYMSTTDKAGSKLGGATALVVAAAAAAIGFAAVYVTFGRPDNGKPAAPSPIAAAEPAPAPASGERIPLSTGAMTAFVFKKTPEPLADIADKFEKAHFFEPIVIVDDLCGIVSAVKIQKFFKLFLLARLIVAKDFFGKQIPFCRFS